MSAIAGIAVFIGLLWFFFGGGLDSASKNSKQDIHDQVAEDAVKQYEIASSQGDKMQKCVQAGLVAAAYLQAQNSQKYDTWKAIEGGDCAVAGLSR